MKGTKQNNINVKRYSYIHPKVTPTTKTTEHCTVEPKIVSNSEFNCVVSIDNFVNKEPGELIVKSKNAK